MPSVNHLGSVSRSNVFSLKTKDCYVTCVCISLFSLLFYKSNGGGKKFVMVLVRGALIGMGFGIGNYLHADKLANVLEMVKKVKE